VDGVKRRTPVGRVKREAQINELISLAEPLLGLRNEEEHSENPNHLDVWSVQVLPFPSLPDSQKPAI